MGTRVAREAGENSPVGTERYSRQNFGSFRLIQYYPRFRKTAGELNVEIKGVSTRPSKARNHLQMRGGRILSIADCIKNIGGRSAGSIFQHDCMSSHIFRLSPTAVDSGYSGMVPLLNKTGTNRSELEL